MRSDNSSTLDWLLPADCSWSWDTGTTCQQTRYRLYREVRADIVDSASQRIVRRPVSYHVELYNNSLADCTLPSLCEVSLYKASLWYWGTFRAPLLFSGLRRFVRRGAGHRAQLITPHDITSHRVTSNKGIAVRKVATPYGNSHAIWDHTVLPATRPRWYSRP